ncbi:unnamed protein product [Echinostoma caproni]|uniref:Uncharacterized protein n=1 Tax=Echinostoma caproni TaxID=27848 RepID=A0A3P8GFD9_9TREM|nr:unnamed protein product [Echinostoma caproni]
MESIAVAENVAPAVIEPIELPHSHRLTISVHQQIGIALLLGYLFMLLVDHLSTPVLESSCCASGLHRLASGCCPRRLVDALGSTVRTNPIVSNEAGTVADAGVVGGVPIGSGRRRATATVGLVFHSFADGLALGVAFAVHQVQLEMIMFLAIILHKVSGFCQFGIKMISEP